MIFLLACSEYVIDDRAQKPGALDSQSTENPPDTAPTTDSSVHDSNTQTVDPDDSGGPQDSDPTVATASIYIHTSTELYSYDTSSHTASLIGRFSEGGVTISDMTDIAIDLNGHMYGGSFTDLYQIDPRNGNCSHVQRLDDAATGLTFLADGRLVIAGNAIRFIDLNTGTFSTLVPAGQHTTSGDIVGLPDGFLYWSIAENGEKLAKVDPNTGAVSIVGPLSKSSLYGLGYTDGTLYGFSAQGDVIGVDPATAMTTFSQRLNPIWWGATTNPVTW